MIAFGVDEGAWSSQSKSVLGFIDRHYIRGIGGTSWRRP
jgi:hypothetical protein